jgi:hypothetical protein
VLINLTPVQNFLAQKAVSYLEEKLHTKVALKHVRIDLLNAVSLEGLYIADRQGDTLLYAGEAKLKITDWFFLKKHPVISYVGLKDAYANLYRKRNSDTWNYQFIIDAFASKKTQPKKKEGGKLEMDLRRADLQNIRFHMVDQWTGSDMIGELGTLKVYARDIDFDKKLIDISSIEGDHVTFGLRDYKGGRPPRPKMPATAPVIDTTPFNPGLWKVALGKLELAHSRFFLEDPDTRPAQGMFDETHMDITGISLDVRNVAIKGDTLTARLEGLSGKERCGFLIKRLAADVTVSPNISECRNLVLQTAYSSLNDYYAMKYDRFPDFEDYLTNVVMVADLKNSEVGMQDIVYFAPDLKRFENISVKISGKGKGTVEKLTVKDLVLNDGISQLKGELYMNGLPDIYNTFIDFRKAEVHTNGLAAFLYVPELRKEESINLAALSQIAFTGSFTGFINDFVAFGDIQTNLGKAHADINWKLPARNIPGYSGNLTTDNFDLGKLFKQEPLLGKATVAAKITGSGFDPKTANIKINGSVNGIELNGYNYRNLKIDGVLASRKFDGKLTADDPNIKLDFDGKVNFAGEEPEFNLSANIAHINAKALGFTEDSIVANADMRLDFKGSNIDNFVGSAYIYNMDIMRDSTRLNIDSLQLLSTVGTGNLKQLFFSTNDISASVTGQFSIMALPQSVQMFLSYYLPQYVATPSNYNTQQNLEFKVDLGNTDDIVSLFNKSIRIGSNTRFTGSMNMANQQLQLAGNVPFLAYGNMRFNDIQINSSGTYSGFKLEAMANGIKMGDRDIASTVQFESNIFQDTARFQLLTTTPTSIGKAELNGVAYADRDSFFVKVLPSEFYLNQSRWEIPAGNEIVFAKNHIAVDNFSLQSGLQSIQVNPKGHREQPNNALVQIRNLDIEPFNTLLGLNNIAFEGRVNGDIHVGSILTSQMIDFDLQAGDIRINGDTVGTARAMGIYDVEKKLIRLEENSGLSYKGSKASVTGLLSLDPTSEENIDGRINLEHAHIAWAAPFLDGYVHNLSGFVNGSISIKGKAEDPSTSGALQLEDIGFTPDITGVHYNIKDGNIKVSDTRFEMGTITVSDDMDNTGTLTGNVAHDKLSKMNFRLNMRSDNIQVVNLLDYQNPNFYGNVMASVQLRLSGPVNNLNMNIFATPQKNSHLYIPIGYGNDLGEYGYVHFKEYGVEQKPLEHKSHNKLNIRLDAVATPDLTATIIIDPATGDQITAKGSGNIILDIPADGDMRMNGNYIIDEGKYNFSFKQLKGVLNYKREFTINSNSVIKWNGDIANADLDVTAYAQIRARLYDLIINEVDRVGLSPQEIRDAQIMQNVNVFLNMQGSLNEPKMSFKLDLAENRSVGTYAYQKLQRINGDDKELLNQVASLLLLEQFVPPEGLNNTAISSGTINNMSELVSSAASSQITNFANKVLGMQDLYVGVRYKNYTLTGYDPLSQTSFLNRNEAGLNLRKSFFNNRLVVEVGGVYDWGRSSAQSDFTTNFAGDFRVQYLLTEDGRIRFNIFRTSNYDAIFLQNIGRQGLGLSYRKSFNTLGELFKSQTRLRKETEEKEQQQQEQEKQQSLKKAAVTDTVVPPLSQLKKS